MMVFQIVDDKKLILEKKSKMKILGLDDQGLKWSFVTKKNLF